VFALQRNDARSNRRTKDGLCRRGTNDALRSGKSLIAGHTHALNTVAYSDFNGVRWGMNSGTLAAPYSQPFAGYTELNPVDWRSGFLVLSFTGGRLLPPEMVLVTDEVRGEVAFRGRLFNVDRPIVLN
jgi:hypothetical protein